MVFYGEDNDPFAASINVNPNHVLSGKNINFPFAIPHLPFSIFQGFGCCNAK
jgi:hypothetical protein